MNPIIMTFYHLIGLFFLPLVTVSVTINSEAPEVFGSTFILHLLTLVIQRCEISNVYLWIRQVKQCLHASHSADL